MRAFCVLAVLLIAALAASPAALAAPATEEYDLALPEADGGGGDSSEDESEAAVAPPTSAPPTAPAPETVAPAVPAAPETGSDRERGGGDGGEQPGGGLFDSPAPDQPIENIKTSGSGDGGFPALLLLLGGIAGTCAGFAIWRMRRASANPATAPPART